jgi:acyl-coenzyme A thioesterase PaaI-like protein
VPLRSPSSTLRSLWRRLSPLPGGRWLFSRLFGRFVRYSGSVRPRIERFEPGDVVVRMADRAAVRNHLGSIHAVALANLGEATGGLAVVGALPDDVRGILVGLEAIYVKKARGPLTAECRCTVPEVHEDVDYTVEAHISDASGEEVATVIGRWRLGLVPREGAHP